MTRDYSAKALTKALLFAYPLAALMEALKSRMIWWLAAALLGIPISANAATSCAVTAPPNGFLGNCSSSLSSGSSCSLSCNAGYTVVGAVTTCSNGVLTATQTCAASACAVTAPTNGTLGSCSSVISSEPIAKPRATLATPSPGPPRPVPLEY
jgi:hypothetical protein